MSIGCLTFASLANLIFVVTWQKPWLLPRPSLLLDGSVSRELLNSGSSFFFIQVAAVVVFSSDNIIVSHYLGAAEVTPYSVTWRLVGFAAVLQSLIFPALWPAYAEAYARRDYGWIRRTFSMIMRGTVVLNLCCVVLLLAFGRTLIRVWAGPAAVPTFLLLLAMGGVGVNQRIHERRILLAGGAEPDAGAGSPVDRGGGGEHCIVHRAGTAHRLRWV